MTDEDQFHAAVEFVSNSSVSSSQETKLRIYSLYKIATGTKLPPSRPSLFDFTGRAKYEAWSTLAASYARDGLDGDAAAAKARREYVDEARKMGGSRDGMENENNGREPRGEAKREKGMVSVSVMAQEETEEGASTPLHDAAVQGDEAALTNLLTAGSRGLVNERDSYGYAPLHLAADRGHIGAVKLLLAAGADLALRDEDGLTALELAREAGNDEVVAVLSAA